MAMAPLARCIISRYRKSSAHRIQTNPPEAIRSIYPVLSPQLQTRPQTNQTRPPEPESGSEPDGTYGSARLSALTIENKLKNK